MLVSEGTDLLHKLFSERTPVSAMFFSAGGDKSRLRGFVSGFTADIELVISETLEPGDAARISVPLANRSYDLRFGDRREFAPPGDPESDALVDKWGDTLLSFSFRGGETLLLYFTL